MVGGKLHNERFGFEFESPEHGIVEAIQDWLSTEEADAHRHEEEDRRHHDPKQHTSKKNPEV